MVDDHSEDGTEEWCQSQDFKYIYIPSVESKGGNYARNLGINAASGEYIAFLDDDDYWLPEKITKQLLLIQDKNCELVFCGRKLEFVNPDKTIWFEDELPNPDYSGDMSKKILTAICCTTTTILVNKEALVEVGLFDENLKFWQEYDLTIRLAQRKPFFYVNEPLAVYRIDCADVNRLTNRFFSWKKAVRYLHIKHKVLYDRLNGWERIGVKGLEWHDAKGRARNSGLHMLYYKYKFLSSCTRLCNLFHLLLIGDFKSLKQKFRVS